MAILPLIAGPRPLINVVFVPNAWVWLPVPLESHSMAAGEQSTLNRGRGALMRGKNAII